MRNAAGRTLHFSSPTGMSGAVPQETSSSNPAGSQGSREHAPDGQHTLKKCSSAGLAVFVHYLTVSKTKGFLVMVDFIYSRLSFSRLLSVHLSTPSHQATQQLLQGLSFLFSIWSFPRFVLCFLEIKIRLLSREA